MNNRAMLGVRTRGHFGVNLQEERALFSMADLQAVTGQLYIAEGEIKEGAPGLLAQPAPSRPSRGRGQDFLFAHLTLTGSAAETAALSQQLLTLISQKYYSSVGSVTAALRDGLMAANQLLLRQNIGSSDPAREGAITLTVFRQGELFTLQAGESVALLGRNFGIERMPPQEPARVTPLGRSSGLDIRYYHHRLQTEDMLLLADPRLSHLPTDEFAPALVESDIVVGLEALTAVVGNDSARLLLVEFSADAPLELTEVRPVVSAAAAAMPDPQPRRQPPVMIADNPEAPTTQLTEPDGSAAVDREIVEHHARRAGSSAALGASRFTAWLADLLARLRPPRQEESEEEKVNWTWAVLIAIVIPLIVAAIVTSVYMAREQAQILSTTKIEMSQKLIVAEEAATPEEARQQYIEILALADQANTELKPGDSDVVQMQSIARTELDKLDGVTRLTADSFYEYSEETSLRRVALREGLNGGVFTLDVGNGAVYEHDTDDTYMNPVTPDPLQILFFGQAVGSRVVGNVVDFFWRPQGFAVQREGLAMLDSDGALITYQPGIN
ncbi:MAG: hypothetical protein GY796_11865, partial [Chloroflexi bacterium]|nr:hypothetical protein [Chloroflexota bacterium]